MLFENSDTITMAKVIAVLRNDHLFLAREGECTINYVASNYRTCRIILGSLFALFLEPRVNTPLARVRGTRRRKYPRRMDL